MNIDTSTLWLTLGFVLALSVLIFTMGKNKFGTEDDLWTATELCDVLGLTMKVPRQELVAMWAQPNQHLQLAQTAASLITSVHRKWEISTHGEKEMAISVQVDISWANGQETSFSGQPLWDELPQEVRAHFIKSSDPIALLMNLPFHQIDQGEV